MSHELTILIRGLGLSLSLIVAIGAQNAFVLRQGLRREHVAAIALISIGSDATMFTIGAAGFGSLVNSTPALMTVVAWLGAAFLFVYGLLSFRSAWRGAHLDVNAGNGAGQTTLRAAALTALAVAWLNPHAYLDTIVLVGGVAGQYPWGERLYFLVGAILASTLWFTGLAYGAGYLAPIFRRRIAWRVLDTLVGGVMWWIALALLRAA
ncbi:MAG: LysE/ArgO family amino acid transporter [Anaerolineae bacterium]